MCEVSGVPESYPGLPPGTRAVQLPDGAFKNSILEAFGRPQRDLNCECERETESTIAQALEMIGGETVHQKIRDPKNRVGLLLEAGRSDPEIVETLYLAALSRLPTAAEWKVSWRYLSSAKDRRLALEDLLWSLLNSKEFLFRR